MRTHIQPWTTIDALCMFYLQLPLVGRLTSFSNSRPPSMLPLAQADDESMSSGDESDDVDLTESSSCGSDVSEWIEGTLPNIVVFVRVGSPGSY